MTLAKLTEALDAFNKEHRHPTKTALQLSALYDLFPHSLSDLGWPAMWPGADDCGVYVFMDATQEVLYVGKASMSNSIGSRLGGYFRYAEDGKSCRVRHDWTLRYVAVISVPPQLSFEAAALEEFLIREVSPRHNTLGRKKLI
jgi:hypothetical protein